MAIPYFCHECGDIVGMEPELMSLGRLQSGNFDSHVHVDCPGRGKHPEPQRSEESRLFGLITRVTIHYPETFTDSSWDEYAGPENSKILFNLALVFSPNLHLPTSSTRAA